MRKQVVSNQCFTRFYGHVSAQGDIWGDCRDCGTYAPDGTACQCGCHVEEAQTIRDYHASQYIAEETVTENADVAPDYSETSEIDAQDFTPISEDASQALTMARVFAQIHAQAGTASVSDILTLVRDLARTTAIAEQETKGRDGGYFTYRANFKAQLLLKALEAHFIPDVPDFDAPDFDAKTARIPQA